MHQRVLYLRFCISWDHGDKHEKHDMLEWNVVNDVTFERRYIIWYSADLSK